MDLFYEKKQEALKIELKEIEYLKYTLNTLLYWDKLIYMPKGAIGYRTEIIQFLSKDIYNRFSSPKFLKLQEYFEKSPKKNEVIEATLKKIKNNSNFVQKIPLKEYEDYMNLITLSEDIWKKAKSENSFDEFSLCLEKIVAHFKNFTKYWGYKKTPYDALLRYYDIGVNCDELDILIEDLKKFIVSLVKEIEKNSKDSVAKDFSGEYDLDKQMELSKYILSITGFDFTYGRVDLGEHPTTLAASPKDVRVVTSFDKNDLKVGIYNTFHEAGKGLYEQGISENLLGTLLAEVSSQVLEESQARFYENIVGRDKNMSSLILKKIKELFPELKDKEGIAFYRLVNEVKPSPIRIEADELTYILHIIIRYEIEKDLLEGRLDVKDLPELWNKKYKEYLGVIPKSFSEGVLQDIHWASGYFGFFPVYLIAELYSHQLKKTLEKECNISSENIDVENLKKINIWLRDNIYCHGALYSSKEILKRLTGENLSSKYYIEYLKSKYYKLYNIK